MCKLCNLTLLSPHFWPYFWVSVLGGLIGVVELVSRYRDNPLRAVIQIPALTYIAFNVVASVLALYIVLVTKPEWLVGEGGNLDAITPARWIMIVFVAGTAALAFFRSSLFRTKIDEVSVPVGPALIIESLLGALDRAVDRNIATPRSEAIKRIMKDIDFDKAQEALASYCLALMQNLPNDEAQRLGNRMNAIKTSAMPKDIKVLNLGLALLNAFGEDVLKQASDALKETIKSAGPLKDQAVGHLDKAVEGLDYEKTLQNLPYYCLTLAGIPQEIRQKIGQDIEAVNKAELAQKTKLLMVCLLLCQSLGIEVLELAIRQLGDEIRLTPAAPAERLDPDDGGS